MKDIYIFDSGKEGKKILFFGAIHGNETCGTEAIKRVIEDLETGNLKLFNGSVYFVPVANEEAYEKNVRMTEENLNRMFQKTHTPQTYEQRRANELSELIDACDVFLDIHSFHTEGKPTVFLDFPTRENRNWARTLGTEYAILGWNDLFDASEVQSYDTTRYAHEHGKIGLLIECGNHTDPASVEVAYRAILSTLLYFGLLSESDPYSPFTEITMTNLYLKEKERDHFFGDWKHLDKVHENELIAVRENGDAIYASSDGVMILPNKNASVGKEWFYLGVVK